MVLNQSKDFRFKYPEFYCALLTHIVENEIHNKQNGDCVTGQIDIRGVTKRFGAKTVIDALDLRIEDGEFLSLLGPSGCGKSTTLRIIAGLEQPSNGKVWLNEIDITDLPPHKRSINTVFQSYALFPHLNVAANIAYALKLRRTDRSKIADQVSDALEMVQMTDHAEHMPRQLSGGQQQRVALARAIVARPSVLLLDEPLSALDLKLRQAMRLELKRLHQRLGITFVYVTHDQGEALTMSDRVAVMHEGKILQLDKPEALYERPVNRYVASFIGEANLITAVVARVEGLKVLLKVGDGEVSASGSTGLVTGATVSVSVRPQRVQLLQEGSGPGGVLLELTYLGDMVSALVRLNETNQHVNVLRLNVDGAHSFGELRPGDSVRLAWDTEAAQVLVQ